MCSGELAKASDSWTPVADIPAIVRALHLPSGQPIKIPIPDRISAIAAVQRWLEEDADILRQAEFADLRRPKPFHDAIRTNCVATCKYYLAELQRLAARVTGANLLPPPPAPASRAKAAYVSQEPKGVALIIGTWNFPLPLHIKPLVTALAAGCPVLLKLNEVCEQTSLAMQKGLAEYVDPRFVRTVFGGVPQATALLQHRFGQIFYTGNETVGRIVYKSAAEHLTPCVLELGGKNPVIVLNSANLQTAVRKIVDAKLQNVGQFCVSPDHIWLQEGIDLAAFQELVDATLREFLGENPQSSPRLSRIVSRNHWQRVFGLVEDAERFAGSGTSHRPHRSCYDPINAARLDDLYIPPAFYYNLPPEARLRQEEVFGPVVAVNQFASLDEVYTFEHEHNGEPLALYVFGDIDETTVLAEIQENLRSGGVCVNDCIVHMLGETLPFGGVGTSGFGNYRGDWGFKAFTHERPVMVFEKDDLHPRLQPP
eukprot:g9892.t1